MVHVSEIDISRVRTMLSDHAVNVISCGSELLSLLVADTSGDQLPHLRTAYVSGGALSRAVVRQWHSAFPGLPIHQGYGSTEAGPIAAGRYSATGIGSDSGPLPLQAAHADCAIELIDDAGVPVRDGCVGQVRVRSRYLADGYLNADPVLEQRFGTDAGGRYFLTGDLGKRNGEGDLVLVSRADRQIKINGRRIELDEVERAMVADEACAQAVVVQTTPAGGTSPDLVALFVPTVAGHTDLLALRRRLESRLNGFAVPQRYLRVDALPTTASGKVDYATAAQIAATSGDVASPGLAGPPSGMVENWIADAWQNLLAVDRPGRMDRFVDLGGDSLTAIEFAQMLNNQFGVPISLDRFAARQTVAALATDLESSRGRRRQPIVTCRADGRGPVCLMVPGTDGTTWIFSRLARVLTGPCDVQALSLLDLNTASAAQLRSAVRTAALTAVQESAAVGRPIVVAGYSFGGMIAADLACWLEDQSVDVAQVCLLDPSPLNSRRPSRIAVAGRRWQRRAANPRGTLDGAWRRLHASKDKKNAAVAGGLESELAELARNLSQAYLGTPIRLPDCPVGWVRSRQMVSKHRSATTVFGAPIEDVDTTVLDFDHRGIIRAPGMRELAAWLDQRLADIPRAAASHPLTPIPGGIAGPAQDTARRHAERVGGRP